MPLDSPLIHMVNKRGRVMTVQRWEVENMRAQGARIIVNPKEDYYPQYDADLNHEESKTPDSIVETAEPTDILEVEDL